MRLRDLVRQVSWYAGGNALLSASKFLLIPVYVAFLPPAEYGVLGTTLTISLFLTLLAVLGVERAVTREFFDHQHDPRALRAWLRTAFTFLVALNVLLLGAAALLQPLLGPLVHAATGLAYRPYVLLAAGIASATAFYAVSMALLQARGRARAYVGGQVARFLASVGTTLALLAGLRAGAWGVLVGELVGTGLVGAALLVGTLRALGAEAPREPVLRIEPSRLAATLRYGVPFVFAELGLVVIMGADRLLLAHFGGFADVGRYTLAVSLAAGLSIVTTAISTGYVPFFFRNARDGAGSPDVFRRAADLYVLLVGSLALAGMLFAPEALALFAPPEYLGAVPLLRVLLVGAFLWGLYNVVVLPLLHLKLAARLPLLVAAGALVNVALNLALIPRLGAMGAAVASAGAYALLFALGATASARAHPLRYSLSSFWLPIPLYAAVGLGFAGAPLAWRAVAALGAVTLGVALVRLTWEKGSASPDIA